MDAAKVMNALNDPKYDFRTVEGLARDSGLTKDEVVRVLKNNPAVRLSHVTAKYDVDLFTPSARPVKWRERLALFIGSLAGTLRFSREFNQKPYW